MYRVLLAEDEPAALRYLRALIETHCPGFSIAAAAADGEEALELARRLEPELVLTDVKMPRLDGIELVRQLKTALPQTPVVIVSGYDDFEYVRRALDTGVVDYVLKPVTAHKLSEVLERLEGALRKNRDAKTLSTVKQLLAGDGSDSKTSTLGETPFRLAVLRYGAPPSRRSRELRTVSAERCIDGWCAIRGRDGDEMIFVANRERVDAHDFASRCLEAIDEKAGAYHTLLRLPQGVPGKRLADEVRALFEALDHSVIVGHSQVVERAARTTTAGYDHLDASRIEYAVINSNPVELEGLIRHQVSEWEEDMVPAVEMVHGARKILETVEQASVRRSDDEAVESVVEGLITRAVSFSDFGESLLRVALEIGHLATDRAKANEETSLFPAIRDYLDSSYSHRHTVDSLRTRFRISASYLSRLFRENTGQSFTEYLRRLRIDAAKRFIRDSPEMPMKNVARYVGFNDPFYFSRVFRSVTGESPTEYARKIHAE